ncbi:baseplate multidomain protein megatron [Shimia ponticola]|uniref:baseplate multidomain protein megatron n=1 Tax=Shimia ponticola TaxID=2582893 RepID=UPI0011BF38D9|nr:glycoside hydrolase/phage tail family protein [Shimia ponticola]
MATVVLSAAGAALGGVVGGSAFGLSSVILGRAIGATVGRAIDQRLMGNGSRAVETARIDRFRLSGASEGSPIAQVYGRMRVSGQTIWATKFLERKVTESSGGGKGGASGPKTKTTTYTYSVSLAVAVCQGAVSHIGRVWADGEEVDPETLNMRVYKGDCMQLPDPKIAAVQGVENTPAFRGTAYVVMEDLELEPFGNRVPQFSFEVTRPSQASEKAVPDDMADAVRAVALMPGSGEYSLATSAVAYDRGFGKVTTANRRGVGKSTDFEASMEMLNHQLPKCQSVSMIVSWFGDDLRCGTCSLTPRVEQKQTEAPKMPWTVSGVSRSGAEFVPFEEEEPLYGGTPTDQSVIQAIRDIQDRGMNVVFYPFVLMTQTEGNSLPDPYGGQLGQPRLPWRGRITTSLAPGVAGSPDGSAAAEAEVEAFFGIATPEDFTRHSNKVTYHGPSEWSYRRFILHYAHMCKLAGGVDAFCLGSEMRGLTQIRGAGNSFPAVQKLKALAADCREILGPDVKIGYAADWSEYFGYHPQDGSGDVFFHLDPLWSDPNIDFIGIDNYMPLSDWREGTDHADAAFGSEHDLSYLMGNVAGGEGYDWYYPTEADRDAQNRVAIEDGAEQEPWVFRYKDIRNWWGTYHHDRVNGTRKQFPTDWEPQSKPIWFTEIGCAAVDKGTNQPNKFLDPKSSESALPYYSTGRRDPLIQLQYLRALHGYWNDGDHNPLSEVYDGPMVDMSRAHVWAWDARPYPLFPQLGETWSDTANHARGHWITGRATGRGLAEVVAEICEASGVTDYDVSRLFGFVRGYHTAEASDARTALQPLMLAFGFDAIERNGTLIFENRTGQSAAALDPAELVFSDEDTPVLVQERAAFPEVSGRVQVNYVDADGDFELAASEAVFPDERSFTLTKNELDLALTRSEGQAIADRWLSEARIARDTVQFSLPPSQSHLGAGDVVTLPEAGGMGAFRIDRVEDTQSLKVEAVRVDAQVYEPAYEIEDSIGQPPSATSAPVFSVFLDLPLLTGDESPHAPYVAATSSEWPGGAAVYRSATGNDYVLDRVLPTAATLGGTQSELRRGPIGVTDRGNTLVVELTHGALSSITREALLNGGNAAAVGDGTANGWEVIQFETAELIAPDTYVLSGLLRGQAGTDSEIPHVWPVGSVFVLLDGSIEQLSLPQSARGVTQFLRVGPSDRTLDDPAFEEMTTAFEGNGLRPYAPVFPKVQDHVDGKQVSWIRRTRIDGDLWSELDVPLGEDSETYVIQVMSAGETLRVETVGQDIWFYSNQMMDEDGVTGDFSLQIAQVSARFGPGARVVINATR